MPTELIWVIVGVVVLVALFGGGWLLKSSRGRDNTKA